jgi:hypothetical protein
MTPSTNETPTLINGKTVIRPLRDNDEIILASGHKLYVPLVYEITQNDKPLRNECIAAEVIHPPTHVNWNAQAWEDDSIQVQKGDTVIFHFLKSKTREDYDRKKGEIIIHYCDIFAVIRNKEIIPINGWLLCRPIEEKTLSQKLHIVSGPKKYSQKVEVRYVSKPTKRYTAKVDGQEWYPRDTDLEDITPGQFIWVEKNSDVFIENDVERLLGEPLFRIQRRQILGIDEEL